MSSSSFGTPSPGSSPRLHAVAAGIAFVALALSVWHAEFRAQIAAAADGTGTAAGAAWIGALSQVGWNVVEASFYAFLWRGTGVRLNVFTLFPQLALYSTLDAFGAGLARVALGHPTWVALIAPFAGAQAFADGPAANGLAAATAGIGAFAVARVALTIVVQARAGAPARVAAGVTVAAWLACRVASWWSWDLLRGASPLR